MSLITSCPACGTMFRVVPDQLKISEGWVRCGHCGEVFDASAHLADEASLIVAAGPEATRPAGIMTAPAELAFPQADVPTQPGELPAEPADDLPVPVDPPVRFVEPPAPPLSSRYRVADGPSGFEADSEPLEPSPLDSPFVFRRSDLGLQGDPSVMPPAPRDSVPPTPHPRDAEEAALDDVSFVRQARRKAFWRRPTVRVLLALASMGLAALLALQMAWQDRDRLALAQPELRPALEKMCELLRCVLSAPRQIEAIVIENSGFNRLRNDTFRLAFTLRNTAGVQVAAPAMELTVTDAQDQPIVRRVLLPAELGAPDATIGAAGEWTRSVGLVLDVPNATRVAGYRLLAFYP